MITQAGKNTKNSENISSSAKPSAIASRPRWHLVYYALAAFDIVAVATGLCLNHSTMSIYEESVAVNESWSDLQANLMQLGRLAAAGNAPGNSVFETRNVEAEKARLAADEIAFAKQIIICRRDIANRDENLDEMKKGVESVEAEFAKMTSEAREIFAAIDSGNQDAAGRHMSAMDHHFYSVTNGISSLTDRIGSLQVDAFAAQRDRARSLRAIEYGLAAMILVMVVAVTIYGHFLALRMQADATKLQNIHSKLVDSEDRSRQVVNSAGDGVVTIDDHGTITEWNPKAEQTFGWVQHEAIGKLLRELIVPDELRNAHPLADDAAALAGKTVEITAIRKDGELLDVELTISPIKTATNVWYSAILHDVTERNHAEKEVTRIHRQLVDASRQAGMAEIATGVLHNVGNVLNSVNISANLLADSARESHVNRLFKVTDLIRENVERLDEFFTCDERGKQLPGYLINLSAAICEEQEIEQQEIESLTKNIEHIKSIVSTQQVYAKVCGVDEPVELQSVLDDALQMSSATFERHNVEVVREDGELPIVTLDRQKLLQILINLIGNAKHAICDYDCPDRRLKIRTGELNDGRISIDVIDTGVGIDSDNLTKIFSHGFTTKKDGHGFGLHASALAAKEMGGSLNAYSDGLGTGARFTLEFPATKLEPIA